MTVRRRFLAGLAAFMVLLGLALTPGTANAVVPAGCTVTPGRLATYQTPPGPDLTIRYTSWGVTCTSSTITIQFRYVTQRWYGGTVWKFDNALANGSVRQKLPGPIDYTLRCSKAGAKIRAKLALTFWQGNTLILSTQNFIGGIYQGLCS